MKKLIFTLISMTIWFWGCQNEKLVQIQPTLSIDLIKVEKVKSMPDLESQKVAFNMLNPKERHYIWYNKIDKIIKSTNKFNEEQVVLLQDFLSNLKVDLYDETKEDQRAVFENVYLKEWNKKADVVFNDTQLYDILLTMNSLEYDIKHGIIQIQKTATSTDKNLRITINDCICNKGSRATCGRLRELSLQGPVIQFGSCVSAGGDCESSSFGCGFGFIFNCNAGYCAW